MKVHPESQKHLTINTHKGLYVCKRLMCGLRGAPAIWQRYVNGLLQGMQGVKVFMDDARITGSDEMSHFKALEEFFKKCKEHGLKLNLSKSQFFQNDINFLGHKIDANGLHKTDEKISVAVKAPVPKNVQEFDIVFRKTADHGNADFLSRLPKTSEELEVKDDITIFQMTQIETLPVTLRELRQETGKDEELGPVLRALREGRNLQGREAQNTIEDGCILYGQRVSISKKSQKNVLDELHTGHLGMVKMKALARSFVYWKDIDKDIEDAVRNCVRHKTDPAKAKVHY
ncbi:Uncharacterized protein K02A2.6 [Araneus ventricosus]|uniref:RNA-directed DNA polymerase n=1 Tax=Araneus ventricosus TaxID=182803 RepID=A0A4Y2TSH2_ARAVE|nr:Uncharacterized protein K02A2.6 [Araneus ventricosus]